MAKINISALSLVLVLALVLQLALAQQQQPQQQQPQQQQSSGQQQPNPNCPIARARAALSNMGRAITNLPSMITNQASSSNVANPLDQMRKNIQNQQRSGSASASSK